MAYSHKNIIIIIFLLVSSMISFGQTTKKNDVLLLKNGERFVGEIILQNAEMIMLKTDDGKRFQFLRNEIAKSESSGLEDTAKGKTEEASNLFGGIIDISGAVCSAPSIPVSIPSEFAASVSLGSKNAFNTSTYLGAGIGLDVFSVNNESEKTMMFIPIFVQIRKTLGSNSIKPYLDGSIGFSASANKNYDGGIYVKLSGGIGLRTSANSMFYFGVFGKIHQVTGTIVEQNEYGRYYTKGGAPILCTGLSISFLL